MVLLPGCPCCGKTECWRCYKKSTLQVCEEEDIAATLEVISVTGFNGAVIDTSEETGLPVGTKFNLESVRPVSTSLCEFIFNYTSPVTGPCRPLTYATSIGLYANLSGNQLVSNQVYGRGNDAVFLGDQQLSCGSIPNNRGGSFPWPDSQWTGSGTHQFTVPVLDLYTASLQIGEIVYEINVIDLSVDDPDNIPEDAYEYQCFDAPPDEEGWEPVGNCHDTEEECNAACPVVPFCQCDEPNVLGNELTMTLQDIKDTGYTPTGTENITCTPEELISQISDLSFHAPFLMWGSGGDGNSFNSVKWGTNSNDPRQGLQAEAECVNLGDPSINNPVRCAIMYELGTSCINYFEEDQFFGKVEWTPSSVILSVGGTQAGTDQRICDFSNTGKTLLEFSKLLYQDPFFINALWENLNYIGDDSLGPKFKNLRLAEFTTDMMLSVNGTTKGGRTMPTTTTGPGTELANLLKWFGIKAKEKGCGCKSFQKKMDRGGPQWCRDHKEEILDHLAKEAKKRRLPFIRLAAEKLLELAIRRADIRK